MKYNFDQVIDRSGTHSMKWTKYENTDILPMWVADMDFQVPPQIVQALKERIDHDIFGYTLVPEQLNQIIVNRMKVLYNWTIESDWIVWLPGVVSALNVCCRAFGSAIDGIQKPIATTTPIYPPFLTAPSNCGCQLVTIPMNTFKQRASLDFNAIEKAFEQGVSLFMLCSPYNPGGTLFYREELEHLVSLCRQYKVVLCSDEIHADFVLDQGNCHIPTASISQEASDITITIMAPSKTYNIPGLNTSLVIVSDPELRQAFNKNAQGIVPPINLLGLVAAQAAYEHCDDWLDQLIAYLRINRDIVVKRVNQMKGCHLDPLVSTYLAWIDVTRTGLENPVEFFEKAGVGLSDGRDFGQKGFVRLNFGCAKSVLEKGLDRMESALNSLTI